ncbi:hypothetical protein Tco_1446364 [Tanacetum coccineum]
MRCEHQKLIVEENRIRLDKAKRLRLEEENMLQLEQQKKNKQKRFNEFKYQQESVPQKEGNDPDLELAKKMSLEAHQEKGEGEGDDAATRTKSRTEVAAPKGNKEQDEVASSTVTLGVGIFVHTEDQAGLDPGKAHLRALAGPDHETHAEGLDWIITTGKILASIKSQVPTVVDKYLGTKLDDSFIKVIKKSKKSPERDYQNQKGNNGKKETRVNVYHQVNDKVALEEFDLKNALFKHCIRKDCKQQIAIFHLYHALMEAFKSTKRRRHDSGASGSAQPPPKDDEQSSKKPQDSDASASKQHPILTSIGWQITDTEMMLLTLEAQTLNLDSDILNIPL